ncbi:hypothetical protein LCGC14_2996810, partial [marine sediment metagenome]
TLGVTANADAVNKDGSTAYTGTGDGFKDEDDMTSDSAVATASQQSIKAYVDTQSSTDTDAIHKTTANEIDPLEHIGTLAATDAILVEDASASNAKRRFTPTTMFSFLMSIYTKDEDAMGSNSATHWATQQSIKAYVDAHLDNAAIHDNIANEITALVAAGTLQGTDVFVIEDADNSFNKRKATPVSMYSFLMGSAYTKDEDTMASNSPTSWATQQSIKAYVDAAVGSSLTSYVHKFNPNEVLASQSTNTVLSYHGGVLLTTTGSVELYYAYSPPDWLVRHAERYGLTITATTFRARWENGTSGDYINRVIIYWSENEANTTSQLYINTGTWGNGNTTFQNIVFNHTDHVVNKGEWLVFRVQYQQT